MQAARWFVITLWAAPAVAQVTFTSNVQTPPQLTGKGVIEGDVVNDVTHEPIKKAQVILNGALSLTAVTGAAGHFVFKDLPAGQYYVQAAGMNFSGSRSIPGAPAMRQIKLEAGAHVTDIKLSLIPNTTISGRVVDEEGAPLANCTVSLSRDFHQQSAGRFMGGNASPTSVTGEYRLTQVSPGKYQMLTQCHYERPLPHALIERGPNADIPVQTYAPQFYPGASDLNSAATVVAAPGVELTGINFRMSPVNGVTVRGQLGSTRAEAPQQNVRVTLEARDPLRRSLQQNGSQVDKGGNFQFRNVVPGSYDLVAITLGDGPLYYAKLSVDVGSSAVEPVEISLAPVPALTGTISIDSESKTSIENMEAALNPLDRQFFRSQPHGQVQKDGTFVLSGVTPGKYQLSVNGAPGYLKSVSLNGQDVSAASLDIPPGAGGNLKVVIGTKWASIEGSIAGVPSDAAQLTGILWPDGEDGEASGLSRGFNIDSHNHFRLENIAPGKYHACALTEIQPWMILNDRMLLKEMESRCESFELTEGGQVTLQIRQLSSEDLQRLQVANH